jgi:hypothetical protein
MSCPRSRRILQLAGLCPQDVSRFAQQEIDYEALLLMSPEDFADMGYDIHFYSAVTFLMNYHLT